MIPEIFKDPEWRAYWDTRSGCREYLDVALRVFNLVSARLKRRIVGNMVTPEYLLALNLRVTHTATTEDPFLNQGYVTKFIAPQFSQQVVEWALNYQKLYEAMLAGNVQGSNDPEDYWTLNQFGWLLILQLTADNVVPRSLLRGYLEGWIDLLGDARHDPSWRSFSISERLCNWINIFSVNNGDGSSYKIRKSMIDQASHLASNLETLRDGTTNNHLLNNGRALYTVGNMFSCKDMTFIGRTILLHEVDRQFTNEGFLDEGSSHYQLIFTRVYLEALRTAYGAGDDDFIRIIYPKLMQMLIACHFFIDEDASEEWQIPFIGDISPDPPHALFGKRTQFWQMVKLASRLSDSISIEELSRPWFTASDGNIQVPSSKNIGWLCYPESGFYRWNGLSYTVWWHARRKNVPRAHAHNDWGSFQMHVHGEPVVIDPGRIAYCDGGELYDGRLTLSQNCVLVDGFEQTPVLRRGLYSPGYLLDGADVSWGGDTQNGSLSVCIHGYERLSCPVAHTRSFALDTDGLFIEDNLTGKGTHSVIAAIHLHPGIKCVSESMGTCLLTTPNGRNIRLSLEPGAEIDIKVGMSRYLPGGYCSRMYGIVQDTTSIFARYEWSDSVRLQHSLFIL